jgi:dihydrofolate reductase
VNGPQLTAIAAVAENGVIGDGRGLLWHLPEDFRRFKEVTMGGLLIMGRCTWESIGRALPGRLSVVVTTRPLKVDSNDPVIVCHGLDAVMVTLAEHLDRRWWCVGGGEIYRLLWPFTTDLDITAVHQAPESTVTFPPIDPEQWSEVSRKVGDEFDFVSYTRRDDAAQEALRASLKESGV